MKRVYGYAFVVAGLFFMLSVAPSWGGGHPGTNDDSDGVGNTGGGSAALANTTGGGNTAYGFTALHNNTTGTGNTATGYEALFSNSTGNSNTAIGRLSGANLTGGNNNIYLGSPGPDVAGAESDTMRLGVAQHRVFIPGAYGRMAVDGLPLYIKPNGKLGTNPSSAHYKRDIKTMGPNSQQLLQLRPVTFTYKEDPDKVRQYGLIAEEVAKVYPELVTHTSKGEVEGVHYAALIPMLLNELQREQQELQGVAELKAQLQRQQQELAALKAHQASVEAALAQMRAQTGAVAIQAALAGR